MIRLIACDLDGTLLDRAGALPAGIFDRIRALTEKGVLFAAASGRQYDNLERMFFPVRKEIAFLSNNGAYVAARGKTETVPFPREMAAAIIRDILDAGMDLLISAPGTSYLLASAPRHFTDSIVYGLRNTVTVVDDPLPFADDFLKISGFYRDGVERFAPPLQEKWGGQVHVDIAGSPWLDFTLANKGTGIRALCRLTGIPLSDTAAFGDHFNDVSMLETVGHPYLMETAPAPLKQLGFTPCRRVLDTMDEILRSI